MNPWRATFYAALPVLLAAGLLTGVRAFYVLLAFGLLVLLAALGQDLWAALSFTYLQSIDAAVTLRGQPVRLSLRIQNERPFPYALMRIRLATADARADVRLDFNLPPKAQRDFDLVLECPHRGAYPIGMTVIDFVDIFGLVRLPFDMRLLAYYRMKELLVLPRTTELHRLALASHDNKAFSRSAAASEDPLEPFSDIRAYRPGDSRRLIHWKASLRQRTLLSRRFDPTEEPHIRLLLDLGRPPYGAEESAQAEDALCEGAASILQYLLRQNWPVEIATHGARDEVRAAREPKDFAALHRWFALLSFDGTRPLEEQLRLEIADLARARSLLVVTTRVGEKALGALRALKDRVEVHCLVCGPARDGGRTKDTASLLRRNGIPSWALRFGEDPAAVLETRS